MEISVSNFSRHWNEIVVKQIFILFAQIYMNDLLSATHEIHKLHQAAVCRIVCSTKLFESENMITALNDH